MNSLLVGLSLAIVFYVASRMDPWVWILEGSAQLDYQPAGGRPMSEVGTLDMQQFVRTAVHPDRRLILVPAVACIPRVVQMVAVLLGARVQEHILTPMLKYEGVKCLKLAFTKAFAIEFKNVVVGARLVAGASQLAGGRSPRGSWNIQVVKLQDIIGEMENCRENQIKARRMGCAILYEKIDDRELSTLSVPVLSAARTFSEFMKDFGKLDRASLSVAVSEK
jgi:hypothetical protein